MTQAKPNKAQLYILGMLSRFGPQHGYRLKQLLSEQVADFAQVEIGNIYYHLKGMRTKGWIDDSDERVGNRPERSVFSITDAGASALDAMLEQSLDADFWAEFSIDAALFFADRLAAPGPMLSAALQRQMQRLDERLSTLRAHRTEVLTHLPPHAALMASALFRHHEMHYEAEVGWIREILTSFQSYNPETAEETATGGGDESETKSSRNR